MQPPVIEGGLPSAPLPSTKRRSAGLGRPPAASIRGRIRGRLGGSWGRLGRGGGVQLAGGVRADVDGCQHAAGRSFRRSVGTKREAEADVGANVDHGAPGTLEGGTDVDQRARPGGPRALGANVDDGAPRCDACAPYLGFRAAERLGRRPRLARHLHHRPARRRRCALAASLISRDGGREGRALRRGRHVDGACVVGGSVVRGPVRLPAHVLTVGRSGHGRAVSSR